MTDIELLQKCIATLESINVPAVLAKQIAEPIMEVSGSLRALRSAILEAARKREEERKNAAEE